jgi:hypothetical protein
MDDHDIQRWIARRLHVHVLDDRFWSLLVTQHEEEVEAVRLGEEADVADVKEYLNLLADWCTRYMAAVELFAGSPPRPTRPYKPSHVLRSATLVDELRSEAMWAAQIEAAFYDEKVVDFRERVLGGRVLTDDEAVDFLSSPANACFPLDVFQTHGVSPNHHSSKVERGELDAPPGAEITVVVQQSRHLPTAYGAFQHRQRGRLPLPPTRRRVAR